MQIQLCQYVFIILIQHFFQDSLPDIVDGLKQWKRDDTSVENHHPSFSGKLGINTEICEISMTRKV